MARKESRQTLETRLHEANSRVWLLEIAFHKVVTLSEQPAAVKSWDMDGTRITWQLFDPTGPMGGFVVIRWSVPGQGDHGDIATFDDLAQNPHLALLERIACEDFRIARDRAFAAKHRPHPAA